MGGFTGQVKYGWLNGGDASKSTADEAAYPSSELKPESALSFSASSALRGAA